MKTGKKKPGLSRNGPGFPRVLLEGELQSPFGLTSSADRIHASAVANAECLVVDMAGAIDRTRRARKNAAHCVWRQVEVAKVKQIEEGHARLDCKALLDRIFPSGIQIKRAQPTEVDFVSRRRAHSWSNAPQGLQLNCRHEALLNQDLASRSRLVTVFRVVIIDRIREPFGIDPAIKIAHMRSRHRILSCTVSREVAAEDFARANTVVRDYDWAGERTVEVTNQAEGEFPGQVAEAPK